MYIIAHRGSSSAAPENTIAAFDLAVQQGADYIELDVQLTMDQHVVVIHDDTVDRTTNGNGFVKSYTLDQLKNWTQEAGLTNSTRMNEFRHYKKFLKDTVSGLGY